MLKVKMVSKGEKFSIVHDEWDNLFHVYDERLGVRLNAGHRNKRDAKRWLNEYFK